MAVSAWVTTKVTKSSTANMARALSRTCHTITAAISIGLPSASLTLTVVLSWLRMRSEIWRRAVNGLTQRRPVMRTVPA
jgi:hypothetical protein